MTYEPTDHPSDVADPPATADRSGSGDFDPPLSPPADPSPFPPPPPMVARRLVRDPYTRLGGVASGLSHHYGVDVSLVRLTFVLFTLVSGFGLLLYLLAWLIIPRAEYWPPVEAPQQLRSISSREFGTGIVVLAVLMALFFSGGTFSHVLVPLLLVAGGLWLLLQPAQDVATAPATSAVPPNPGAPTPGTPATPAESGAGAVADSLAGPAIGSAAPPVAPRPPAPPVGGAVPPGTPVAPRRRRWTWVLIGFLALLIIVPLMMVAVAVAFLVSGGVDFGSGFEATYRPELVDEIPAAIDHGQGQLVVDLTEIDPADFDGDPVPLAIDMGMGEVRVLVPEGVQATVDAGVSAGDVEVFGNHRDGLGADVSVEVDAPDLELDIQLDFGQITVERVDS